MGKAEPTSPKTIDRRVITPQELAAHRTPGDAWVSYRGKVYDVSNWNEHPGGSVIFTHAGDDCTDIFAAFHPASAAKLMERFDIGDLDDAVVTGDNGGDKKAWRANKNKLPVEQQKQFEKAYRELRAQMMALGLFNASLPFYAYKVTSNVALLMIAAACAMFSNLFIVQLIGAVVMGLFWQQCGWLSHDFLHHQVFKNRLYGDLMGILLGNVFQGFSVHWWKMKHNSHHAVPNLEASTPESADGDPDIDTMPILAWTMRMARLGKNNPTAQFMIRWQAYLYFPVLLLARLSWAHQSWVFVWGGAGQHSTKLADEDRKRIQYPTLEKIGLIIHYAGLLYILSHLSLPRAIAYFIVAQTSCGLFLATVFGLGHNGMAVYPADERPDFWKLQVSTTRNIISTPFIHWFCGGLEYQVDHHLFPMLPRHHLPAAHALVESFCKEYNVTYHEANVWDGTVEVLSHLSEVSLEFVKEFPAM